MKKKLTIITLVLLILGTFYYSCKKEDTANSSTTTTTVSQDFDCPNAKLIIVNQTKDTILYGWNTSSYDDTLYPNKSITHYVGHVYRKVQNGTVSEGKIATSFCTASYTVSIWVDTCVVTKIIK